MHTPLEPLVSVAEPNGERLTVHTASQSPSFVRIELARLLGWPENRIRVRVPFLGGGFGAKLYIKLEALVSVLALLTGRPVKVSLSMEEQFFTITKHATTFRIKSGVANDGRIVARECEVWWNGGAYADIGPRVTQKSGFTAPGKSSQRGLALIVPAVVLIVTVLLWTSTDEPRLVGAASQGEEPAPGGTLGGPDELREAHVHLRVRGLQLEERPLVRAAQVLGVQLLELRLLALLLPVGAHDAHPAQILLHHCRQHAEVLLDPFEAAVYGTTEEQEHGWQQRQRDEQKEPPLLQGQRRAVGLELLAPGSLG